MTALREHPITAATALDEMPESHIERAVSVLVSVHENEEMGIAGMGFRVSSGWTEIFERQKREAPN